MNQSASIFIDAILQAAETAPAAELLDLRVGQFWIAINTSIGCGMASAMRSEAHLHGARPIEDAGRLHLRTPAELATLMRSSSAPEAGVGMAAANALFGSMAEGLSEEKAVDILTERGSGKRVAMIGHFPFAEKLGEHCDQLWIFERGLNRRGGDLSGEAMDQLLPQADVVAVTATTLLNKTLPAVLASVNPKAFLMLLGPTTPLTPALFKFGFDVLCGTLVEDPKAVLRAVEQGAVTKQITGVRRVSMWSDGGN